MEKNEINFYHFIDFYHFFHNNFILLESFTFIFSSISLCCPVQGISVETILMPTCSTLLIILPRSIAELIAEAQGIGP